MEDESVSGLKKLSEACWAQARADYAASVTLLDAGVYLGSVFFAQQAAEQALKAANIQKLQKIPRGHNLIQMCNALDAPLEIMNAAAEPQPRVSGDPQPRGGKRRSRAELRSQVGSNAPPLRPDNRRLDQGDAVLRIDN